MKHSIIALATAGLVLSGAGAYAQPNGNGSTSVLGLTPAQRCAAASAAGVAGKPADQQSLQACAQAISWDGATQSERAAGYLNRGVLHMTRSELTLAVADYNAALDIQPNLVEALIDRGCAEAAQHQPQGAIADFTQAIALAPQQPASVYYNRALAREDTGDLKGAYLDYRKAAQLEPNWDRPKQELARFTVAKPGMS